MKLKAKLDKMDPLNDMKKYLAKKTGNYVEKAKSKVGNAKKVFRELYNKRLLINLYLSLKIIMELMIEKFQ